MNITTQSPVTHPQQQQQQPYARYQQQQPYPSPLPTHPPRPYRRPPRPIQPAPNGVINGPSPQYPMTPPYPHYQSPNSSTSGDNLPSNHIHIVQSTAQPMPVRSNSTISNNSINMLPPLSLGPSSAGGEEVVADMGEQFEPTYALQQRIHANGHRQYGVYHHEAPPPSYSAVQQHSDTSRPSGMDFFWQRPLIEDGAGLRILNDLVESIGAMEGGDFDSWLSLVTTHFEDLSRFQLVLTGGEQLQMFDIPTHYLPRFFLSLPSIPSITLVDPVESPADEAGCLILCPDLEWQWRNDRFQNHELAYGKDERQIEYSNEDGSESKQQTAEDRGNDLSAIWKGALSVNVGATRKIERLEIILQVDDGKGGVKVFPESAIRSLKIAQGMESFALVMRLAHEESLAPQETLQRFIHDD
ncbi:hypothetical protein L204_102128 [Cryptococcus depauperatus]